MTVIRDTQLTTELLTNATPNFRESQLTAEVLSGVTANFRETQLVLEVLSSEADAPSINLRDTQVVVETLGHLTVNFRESQLCVEVLSTPPPPDEVFIDSCQRYGNSTHIGYQYTASGATVNRTYRRARQTQSIRLESGGYLQRPVTNGGATAFIGAAVRLGGYPSGDQCVLQFRDGSEEVAGLYLSSGAVPKIKTDTHTYCMATDPVSTTGFVYLELEVLMDNATGLVRAYVDGTLVCEATGVDTVRTTNSLIDSARWIGPGISYTYFTSLYCRTFAEVEPDEMPFGNIEVHPYIPIADNSVSGWTPSVGINAYYPIDETIPLITDYLYSDTAGNQYRLNHTEFQFPNSQATQQIIAVQPVYLIANEGDTTGTFKPYFNNGGINRTGIDKTIPADDTWRFYTYGLSVDPFTEEPWGNTLAMNLYSWGGKQL